MMPLQSMFSLAVLQLRVKTNQVYLITAGFLHKHSYECDYYFAVVSVNRHQLLVHSGRYFSQFSYLLYTQTDFGLNYKWDYSVITRT